jgi:hypothetical protein
MEVSDVVEELKQIYISKGFDVNSFIVEDDDLINFSHEGINYQLCILSESQESINDFEIMFQILSVYDSDYSDEFLLYLSITENIGYIKNLLNDIKNGKFLYLKTMLNDINEIHDKYCHVDEQFYNLFKEIFY